MKPSQVLKIIAAIMGMLTLMAMIAPAEGINVAGVDLRYPTL